MEDGRLDLHRSVNAYLSDFHITEERGTITLHHLLTHTAGFDERLTGMAARSPAGLQPLADYLARSMPPVFIEPDRVISYSNRGWSRWLGSTASALNLVFLVGFPIAFLGRIEGGLPDFVYGVPLAARALLLVPVVTGIIAVATLVAVVADLRNPRTSQRRLADCLVVAALLSFVAFAWYWNLLPPMREF